MKQVGCREVRRAVGGEVGVRRSVRFLRGLLLSSVAAGRGLVLDVIVGRAGRAEEGESRLR